MQTGLKSDSHLLNFPFKKKKKKTAGIGVNVDK